MSWNDFYEGEFRATVELTDGESFLLSSDEEGNCIALGSYSAHDEVSLETMEMSIGYMVGENVVKRIVIEFGEAEAEELAGKEETDETERD